MIKMADYNDSIMGILQVEAGYSNDVDDSGGETIGGISRNNWPHWEGWNVVDGLKTSSGFPKILMFSVELRKHILEFYKENFWDKVGGDKIADGKIAYELMDTAINQGIKNAVRDVQRSLNLLNNQGKFGEDIEVDGFIGKETIDAINSYPFPWAISSSINGFQFNRYVAITEKNPSQEKFFRGWLTRIKL